MARLGRVMVPGHPHHKAELVELARRMGLPADGTVKELKTRLRGKLLGGDRKHVHGKTLCPSCGHVVIVTFTAPGRYRRIRCNNCGLRDKIAWR